MLPVINFPNGVHAFFSYDKKDISVLSANEFAIAEKYGTKRLGDFCTGRYCLRSCTELLGYSGDILVGERGKPLLPDNIAASVSHSKTLCGAIAADTTLFQSVGIDIESIGRVHKDMWHLLFTPNETSQLVCLDEPAQQKLSTIFFSMKEAFYKMQYPLTATYLDFKEVEVIAQQGRYSVKLLTHVNEQFRSGTQVNGTTHSHNDQIITWCLLPSHLS
jgi:phosphopantetheine--protein transferase-like protein